MKIPREKPYIYLKGGDQGKTIVTWDAHDSIATDATFTSEADNTIVESITFIVSEKKKDRKNFHKSKFRECLVLQKNSFWKIFSKQ